MISVINFEMGNLGSIANMLHKINAQFVVTNRIDQIIKSDKIILPGVGSFDQAIKNLNKLSLIPVLNKMVLDKKTPVLGICLGMQLLTKKSEEGVLPGLGWIDATTKRFTVDKKIKIPHMSWNEIDVKKSIPLLKGLNATSRFYFVHSYYVQCKNQTDIAATSKYGLEFTSIVQKDNIMGVQFHPEKSHRYGLQLITNFCNV